MNTASGATPTLSESRRYAVDGRSSAVEKIRPLIEKLGPR